MQSGTQNNDQTQIIHGWPIFLKWFDLKAVKNPLVSSHRILKIKERIWARNKDGQNGIKCFISREQSK